MKRLLYKYVLLLSLGLCLSSYRLQAQEGLQISTLFEKYGDRQNVTMVELNGKILKSYKMSKYRSLVFKDVTPYLQAADTKLRAIVASETPAEEADSAEMPEA